MIKNRRGQEEMVGFILIIILVVIVAVVFLGISLHRGSVSLQESANLDSFMTAFMDYSTDCSVTREIILTMKDLVKECSQNRQCLDGRDGCSVLGNNTKNIMDEAFPVTNESANSYHSLMAEYSGGVIVNISSGTCAGSRNGAQRLIPGFSNDINIELEVCSA